MKAAWFEEFGSAAEVLRLGEHPTPEAGPGEVRVRVAASGVNPVDVKRRQGGRGEMEAPRVIPHFDGAGEVDQVGDGVEGLREGDRVWFYEAQWGRPFGAAAEWVTLPASRARPLPESTSAAEGAALGIPALTAHRAVFGDGSVSGKTVLVTGGAGDVGRYAIQFAKLGGARVISTVSGDAKGAIATGAGADAVVNYRTENVAGRLHELTDGVGVDRIVEVELGGNLETSLAALATQGAIAAYASEGDPTPTLPFYAFLYKGVTLHHVIVFLMPEEAKLTACNDIDRWLAEGRLTHLIGPTFPLDDIVTAHETVEAGVVGKIVVEPSPGS